MPPNLNIKCSEIQESTYLYIVMPFERTVLDHLFALNVEFEWFLNLICLKPFTLEYVGIWVISPVW